MNKLYPLRLISAICLVWSMSLLTAQQNPSSLAQDPDIVPIQVQAYRNALKASPLEGKIALHSSPTEVSLPLFGGKKVLFKILESPIIDQALSLAYPDIRT